MANRLISGLMAWALGAVSAAALAQPAPAPDGQANGGSPAAASVPDFSGLWSKGRERIGAVKNLSPYLDRVMGDYNDPILKPWAAAQVKQHADMERAGTPPPEGRQTCWPSSVPNVLSQGGVYQILQTPDTVVLLYSNDREWRFVRLNRDHPAHITPSWYGDSVGHYEGDTLVVDTVGLKTHPMSMVDKFGTPHTDALHVIERYRRAADGKSIIVTLVVDDPGTFTHKWTVDITLTRSANLPEEGECAANNRLDIYGPSIGKMPEAPYKSPFR
jgi:hypothetical protein